MLHAFLFVFTVLLGVFSSIVYNPIFTFVTYQAIYFFNPLNRWWGYYLPVYSYSFMSVMLMLIVYLFNYKKVDKNLLLEVPAFKWIYLTLSIYAFTYFLAVNASIHLDALYVFFKLIIIISIAYKLCDTVDKLNYVIWGNIFGATYVSFLIYQTGRNSGNRVEGIGTVDAPDVNGIAAALAPCLVFTLYYLWERKRKLIKIIFVISGGVIANALILMNSRGAYLGAFVSISYFMFHLYFSKVRRNHQLLFALFLTFSGLLGVSILVDESFMERISTITMKETNTYEDKESGSTRFIFWGSAFDMAKDYPFGAGYRSFEYYAPFYLPEIDTGRTRNRAVHSTWFEALTEIGFLGLFTFTMALVATYRSTYKIKRKLYNSYDVENYFKIIALEAALLGFIVSMTFLNRLRAEVLYWLIMYIACAYNIYVLKEQNREHSSQNVVSEN